jgi:hypothetical protein
MGNRKLIVELVGIFAAIAMISVLILIGLDQSNPSMTLPWSIS